MKPLLKVLGFILLVMIAYWFISDGLGFMSDAAHKLADLLLWVVPVGAGLALLWKALTAAGTGSVKAADRALTWQANYEIERRHQGIFERNNWKELRYFATFAIPLIGFVFAVCFLLALGLHLWQSAFGPISWL
jgi:hypothetical protein